MAYGFTLAAPAARLSSSKLAKSAALKRPTLSLVSRRRNAISVTATSSPDKSEPAFSVDDLAKRCATLMDRYDFLSAGLGALAVTTVCVAHGQSPSTALWITAASTVIALLVNDCFFEDK